MCGGENGSMKLRVVLIMAVILIGLSVTFFLVSRPEPLPPAESRPFVWSIETDQLREISITLPRAGLSEVWVRHEDKLWYFSESGGPSGGQIVDMDRWGGGVPLLLSGPGAERRVIEITETQLISFGLKEPGMLIDLTLATGETISAAAGDLTLDGKSCYVMLVGAMEAFTVDYTWCKVLEGLVLEPPYSARQEE